MKLFSRLTAIVGLVAVAASAFAQTPPAPPAAPGKTAVKGYTRTMKNGKTVTVKGYARGSKMTPAPTGTAVKGYTRKTKSGKVVTVKGYTRKPTTMSPKMMTKPGQKMTKP